jgi:two-component system sensor histidine kinase KdpD
VRAALEPPELHIPEPRRAAFLATVVAGALGLGTLMVAVLEGDAIAVSDASPVYLVAVVIVGIILGTWPALLTAIASFLAYDVFFTEPRLSLVVADPREWLDLVLFLFLAVVVGRLSALGSERAVEASRRAAESTALFFISRTLSTAPDLASAAMAVSERLVRETGLERVWITVVDRNGRSTVLADSQAGQPLPSFAFVTSLVRTPGENPARWVRSHAPSAPGAPPRPPKGAEALSVRMEADGATIGSVKATRHRAVGDPPRSTGRLLGLAADQLALAIRREQLRRDATEAEIARQGDTLKSALLDAVSHDLRTPLASIRAAAGALIDPDIPLDPETARSAGIAIDLEAQRLDRLVREVLDMSRIEAGALRPDLEVLDVAAVVEPALDRLRPLIGDRSITIDLPADLPPVRADAVLIDTLIGNLLENAARYAPPPAPIAISARAEGTRLRLAVEDGGPGVPSEVLSRLFDKFYRVDRQGTGSRRGLGIGLSVVRGLAESMGGEADADASPLGGLRVTVGLPLASEPSELAEPAEPAGETNADAVSGSRSPGLRSAR